MIIVNLKGAIEAEIIVLIIKRKIILGIKNEGNSKRVIHMDLDIIKKIKHIKVKFINGERNQISPKKNTKQIKKKM